jgi:hypothetical protein
LLNILFKAKFHILTTAFLGTYLIFIGVGFAAEAYPNPFIICTLNKYSLMGG